MLKRKQKPSQRGAWTALVIATAALAINFWAWSLLSPLGTKYSESLGLEPLALSLLLAVPVIIGALGRIVLGTLADKFGGRNVFAATCLFMVLPVLGLVFAESYVQLVVAATLLGLGGASFAIGVPFVSAWFPPGKRGLALGLYSMGNAGTAVSGFLTPRMSEQFGTTATFVVVAALLLLMAISFMVQGRNAPSWRPPKGSALTRLAVAGRLRITWDLASVYVITFGAFVAFGVYLPVLLKVQYGLDLTDAAARAAGFVLLATVARPVGGWLSDRIGAKRIIPAALAAVVVLATFIALQPALHLRTTVAYLSLACVLGCANGAVFALVGRRVKPDTVGSVTGIVGAVGGLGGFLPPLILGLTYQHVHSYAPAFIMLASCAFAVWCYMVKRFKDTTLYPALGHTTQ